jgi:hypothetical protein
MQSQITARKASIRSNLAVGLDGNDKADVFSLLVQANELEAKAKLQLADQEVVCYYLLKIRIIADDQKDWQRISSAFCRARDHCTYSRRYFRVLRTSSRSSKRGR